MDQHIHRHLKDEEGKLFAAVLAQAKRGLQGYSQGVYLFTPAGRLLEFANTADAGQERRMLASALRKFDPAAEAVKVPDKPETARSIPDPPEGGLVLTVTSKVLGGYDAADPRTRVRAESLGRDHLWVRKDEAQALAGGDLPESLTRRLARFHLVDNTRGEPPFWRPDEVRKLELGLRQGRLSGTAHVETASGDRAYRADLLGFIEAKGGSVTRFDLVARGDYWGEGQFTPGAPKGKYPFAISFRLTPAETEADRALPGGARGNLAGYLG